MAVAVERRRARIPERLAREGRFRREVGFTGLMFVSLGSIIGSGWLFGALNAAQQAGPAALVSWGIGAAFVLLLALIHAELGSAYPVSGAVGRFPHYSHGSIVGFMIGWLWWLGAVTVAPIEVEASLQYFTHYLPWLTSTSGGSTVLTPAGYGVAVALMAVFTIVNALGVAKLAKSNNVIMLWKIAIPVLTVIALLVVAHHGGNFSAGGGFAPYGFHGIFSAISTGGVIFAYQGFEQAVQLGGESSNPHRNIPLAVIAAMIFGVVLYVALQVAFLAALAPHDLAHGWAKLTFNGVAGPFAGLAGAVGLGWLAILLYVDAAVSPGGTGLLYTGTSARAAYALGRNGYVSRLFAWLSDRGVPAVSVALSFVVGILVFLPFPGWQKLVGFITAAAALAYAMAPLALSALRRQDPDRTRPFRLPLAGVLAPAGFVVANLIVYWAGWNTDWRMLVAIGIGFVVFAASRRGDRDRLPSLDLRSALWVPPYLGGLAVISWLGRYDGGRNLIPFWWDVAVVAVFSVAIYALAIALRLSAPEAQRYIGTLAAEEDEPLTRDVAVAEEH